MVACHSDEVFPSNVEQDQQLIIRLQGSVLNEALNSIFGNLTHT